MDRPSREQFEELEKAALTPHLVSPQGFNKNAVIPHGCTIAHVENAMREFLDFLGFINQQLHTRKISRLESMLMSANFSSIVGEFMIASIPKYCSTLVRNKHHSGHPDLVPKGYYPNDDVLHGTVGIEIKASRYSRAWQGHNNEAIWLLVFVFESNRRAEDDYERVEEKNKKSAKDALPKPFRFIKVVGAQLEESDWTRSGRAEGSRRTITSSVNLSGYQKMMANWIYQDPLFIPNASLDRR